jgi:hypothetical protein
MDGFHQSITFAEVVIPQMVSWNYARIWTVADKGRSNECPNPGRKVATILRGDIIHGWCRPCKYWINVE